MNLEGLGLTYAPKSVSVIDNPWRLSLSIIPSFDIQKKNVSVIDIAQGSDVQQMELSPTFCNNYYGERIQESTDMLCGYVITKTAAVHWRQAQTHKSTIF